MAEMEGQSLTQAMGLTQEEVARRKQFLELGDKDVERLRRLHDLAEKYAGSVIEQFYNHLLGFDESRAFFKDPAVLERVKAAQRRYFLEITQGIYDTSYIESRLRIGLAHEHINLPIKLYLGMYRPSLSSLKPHDIIIFATDGIQSGFIKGLSIKHLTVKSQQIADFLLAEYDKGTDDSLVLVVRYLGCGS